LTFPYSKKGDFGDRKRCSTLRAEAVILPRFMQNIVPPLLAGLILLTFAPSPSDGAPALKATLNGAELEFDADTGALLRLSYPGVGDLLRSTPERSSLIDLAYPHPRFEVLRLASRYSRGAKVTASNNSVVVQWDKLGMSRTNFVVEGNVSATVRITAAPDGRSLIFIGSVQNQSSNAVRQVLFPDLMGLVPVGEAAETLFRHSLGVSRPFVDLAPNEAKLAEQYMTEDAAFSAQYKSGGLFSTMGLRWLDYGSLKGGFSLYPRQWGWDEPLTVRLHLSEAEQKLRLLVRHDLVLAPGQQWQSQEFWLTPHAGGWAKGIEPFRAWVKQNYKRQFPLPGRVRDGIGFRTIWMCQIYPNDPQDAIFKFSDLPALARETIAHGLQEMVMWAWVPGFERPLPPPFPHLGKEQELYDAVQVCKQLGVTVSPFISVVQATKSSAPRYGLTVGGNNGWTYHTELVPRWNPPYASQLACVGIPTSNPLWQEDVLVSCKKLVDHGIPSLSWDQYWTTTAAEPNMQSLTRKIREYAIQRDPEATFSGEELWNLEIDSSYLDFTWNWGGWRDCGPLTSVLPTPRVNACINSSALAAKKVFADNLYLNIMPRRKESPNATDWISNYPEMSRALKQCAARRQQFLSYFTQGTFIGGCLLAERCPGAHTAAYVLPDRLLLVLINEGAPRKISFTADLGAWLPNSEGWHVRVWSADGKRLSESKLRGPKWHGKTPLMARGEMMFYQVTR
jgi:hypothetical protein